MGHGPCPPPPPRAGTLGRPTSCLLPQPILHLPSGPRALESKPAATGPLEDAASAWGLSRFWGPRAEHSFLTLDPFLGISTDTASGTSVWLPGEMRKTTLRLSRWGTHHHQQTWTNRKAPHTFIHTHTHIHEQVESLSAIWGTWHPNHSGVWGPTLLSGNLPGSMPWPAGHSPSPLAQPRVFQKPQEALKSTWVS